MSNLEVLVPVTRPTALCRASSGMVLRMDAGSVDHFATREPTGKRTVHALQRRA